MRSSRFGGSESRRLWRGEKGPMRGCEDSKGWVPVLDQTLKSAGQGWNAAKSPHFHCLAAPPWCPCLAHLFLVRASLLTPAPQGPRPFSKVHFPTVVVVVDSNLLQRLGCFLYQYDEVCSFEPGAPPRHFSREVENVLRAKGEIMVSLNPGGLGGNRSGVCHPLSASS